MALLHSTIIRTPNIHMRSQYYDTSIGHDKNCTITHIDISIVLCHCRGRGGIELTDIIID